MKLRVTLALLLLALLVDTLAATVRLYEERATLQSRVDAQQPLLEDVQTVREQLRSILVDTRRLAAEGNANAALLVDELQRQGVRFDNAAEG